VWFDSQDPNYRITRFGRLRRVKKPQFQSISKFLPLGIRVGIARPGLLIRCG
jgi:hypothetical protein